MAQASVLGCGDLPGKEAQIYENNFYMKKIIIKYGRNKTG
jgi:hypothetical protein